LFALLNILFTSFVALVVGERYIKDDFRIGSAGHLAKHSSGVLGQATVATEFLYFVMF